MIAVFANVGSCRGSRRLQQRPPEPLFRVGMNGLTSKNSDDSDQQCEEDRYQQGWYEPLTNVEFAGT